MNYMTKLLKHIKVIVKHKHYVFKASIEAGIPFRGFFHDMSKFSPIELFNSAKYYTGTRSPIDVEKDEKGYSLGWLHHRGRNPHHWEYWIDDISNGGKPLKIPFKYVKEMICDWIGAGKAYNKNKWNIASPINWYYSKMKSKDPIKLHPITENLIHRILIDYSKGENLKDIFNKYEKLYNENKLR